MRRFSKSRLMAYRQCERRLGSLAGVAPAPAVGAQGPADLDRSSELVRRDRGRPACGASLEVVDARHSAFGGTRRTLPRNTFP